MKSLMAQANWVVWRKDSERGKVPVNPYTGGNAMSNNPSTWSDYHTAQATARQYDGIGLMFYEGIGGIDIDGHNGDNALANEVLSLFANTYCEISPTVLATTFFSRWIRQDCRLRSRTVRRR